MVTSELLEPSARPNEIVGHRFRLARRGFDPEEVHEYLRVVAEQVSAVEQELQWQRARNDLLEHQSESAREAAYARVSRHLTDVIRAADAAAARLRADAEHDARAVMAAALEKARRVTAAAQQEAEYIRSLAREEAANIKESAKVAARTLKEEPPDEAHRIELHPLDSRVDVPALDVGSQPAKPSAGPGL